jgi:cytochrome c553
MGTRVIAAALAVVFASANASAAAPPPLVAGCVGCHVDGGDPRLPKLAGRSAADIVAAVKAFRNGSRPATVMDRIAKGFSDDEIAAIAAWYAAQR